MKARGLERAGYERAECGGKGQLEAARVDNGQNPK